MTCETYEYDNPLAVLIVEFWREGMCLDFLPARSGERACLICQFLAEDYAPLRPGDQFIIRAGD